MDNQPRWVTHDVGEWSNDVPIGAGKFIVVICAIVVLESFVDTEMFETIQNRSAKSLRLKNGGVR